jgi:hypothetical protein
MMGLMISRMPHWTLHRAMLTVALAVALIGLLYWAGLPNVGAAGIIIGFLFLLRVVAASGWISITRLLGRNSIARDLSPGVELAKAAGFLVVGVTAALVVVIGMNHLVVPHNLGTAMVLLTIVLVSAIGSGTCLARFGAAILSGRRR